MNTIISFVILLFCLNPDTDGAFLRIKITDVKSNDGKMMIAVYNNKETYNREEMAYKKVVVNINELTAVCELNNLPMGQYAVAVFHDANSNKKLDTNMIGIPKEGFGFSNNPKSSFGPPGFDKAQFSLDDDTTISISLIYL